MRVLVDTNIILDVILERENFYTDSNHVFELCKDKKIHGILAVHTITNLFYILRKKFSNTKCREIIMDFLTIFKVEKIDGEKIFRALINENFKDFEDRLQIECAIAIDADYIITRDKNDFVGSEISCVTPGEFCDMFKS